MPSTTYVIRQWVEVRYVKLEVRLSTEDETHGPEVKTPYGAAGSTRMWLNDLPEWIANNPGTLVLAVEPV